MKKSLLIQTLALVTLLMTPPIIAVETPLMTADCGEEDGCDRVSGKSSIDLHAGQWFELEAVDQEGCLVVKKAKARPEQNLVLGKCGHDPENVWRYNNGLFHSKLNDDMCMQAGKQLTASRGRKM